MSRNVGIDASVFLRRPVVLMTIIGLLIGIIAFKLVTAESNALEQKIFPKNQYGQTYGSALDTTSENEPDLIKAIGIDGTAGYVKSSDLMSDKPKSPKEAAKLQPKDKEINLYDVDGRTVIGKFIMTSGRGQDIKMNP